MKPSAPTLLRLWLVLALLAGVLPACNMPLASREESLDEALLLMYAGQMALMPEAFEQPMAAGVPHLALLAAQKKTLNEVQALLTAYEIYYADVAGGLEKQGYATDHPVVASVWKEMETKTAALRAQRDALEAARARWRPSGIRRFGDWLGRRVAGVMNFTGRTVQFVVEDVPTTVVQVAPELARQVVQEKVQREKSKLFEKGFQILARKIGPTPVAILREVVIPLIKRNQERQERKRQATRVALTAAAAAAQTAAAGRVTPAADETPEEAATAEEPTPEDELGTWTVGGEYPGVFDVWWNNYWTGLPDDMDKNCQPTGHAEVDVVAGGESLPLTMRFDFNRKTVQLTFRGTATLESGYDKASATFDARTVDSWVRANIDRSGWEFGGELEVPLTLADDWRCWQHVWTESGDNGFFTWIHDEKRTTVRVPFEGATLQGGERGGSFDLRIGPEDPEAAPITLFFLCEACDLPPTFPPPEK
jgi:hypothetical protein